MEAVQLAEAETRASRTVREVRPEKAEVVERGAGEEMEEERKRRGVEETVRGRGNERRAVAETSRTEFILISKQCSLDGSLRTCVSCSELSCPVCFFSRVPEG